MKKKVLSLFLTVTLVSSSFLETTWAAEPQSSPAVEAADTADSASDDSIIIEDNTESASVENPDSNQSANTDDAGTAEDIAQTEESPKNNTSDDTKPVLSESASSTGTSKTDTDTSSDGIDSDANTDVDTEPTEDLSIPELISAENCDSGVKVSWNAVTGAAGYRIYRKDGLSDWTPAGISDSTVFTDATAVSGTTYTYTVQAYKGSYEDAVANPDSKEYWSDYDIEGLSVYALSVPSFSTAEHAASGIQLKWNTVQGASGYELYRRTSDSSWESIANIVTTSYTDTSVLTDGEVYYYSVQAYSNSGKSYFDGDGTPVRKFATPSLTGAENANKGIKVSWKAVPNAEGYYVYRKTSGASWKRLGSTVNTSYTDSSSLSNGTKYFYTVRAYEGTNRSWYDKNGVSEVRIDTPTLTSTENTSTGITVKWKAVNGATSYRLYRKVDGGSWTTITNTSSTSYTDKSSLSYGTEYIYTVRAYKNSDRSYYDTIGITAAKLSIPTLSKAENSSGGIKITWKSVKGADSYRVYRKTSGGSWKRIIDSTEATSYTDTANLTSGTKYYYTVRAIKGSCLSYYNTKGITETKLGSPVLSKAENASGGVKITWKSVKGADSYRVYRKTSGGSWKRIVNSTKTTSYTDKGSLSSGTEYLYTVRAIKGSDLSWYDTKGITTLNLSTPTLIKAENISNGIKITWKSVKGADKYRVYRKTSGGSWKRVIDFTDQTSYTDTSNLASGTKYYYTVRAIKGSSFSYYNTKGIAETKLSTPVLSKAENASGGIKITWKSVKGASAYRVYRKTSNGSWKRIINSTKSTSYIDKSTLSSGTKYLYTVRAIKGSDLSYYDTKGVTELKLSNPSLSKAESTASGIKITWKSVKGADHYRVYRRTSGGSWLRLVDSTTATSYTDKSSLSSGTKYIYTVRAFTGSDWSWYNSGISITKLSTPTLVKAENASGGIKVTWKSVKGASGYRVYRKTSGSSWKRIVNSTKGTSYTDKSSLSSGTKYIYTVRALKGSDLSYYNTKGVTELKLSNPSLTGATKVSGGIKVTWKSVKGASGYYVYRKTSSSSWSRLASTKSTSYTDKKAKSGVSYIYTVRAYNGSDLSWYNSGVTINKMLSKAQSYSSNTKWLILVDTKANKVGIYYGSKNNWTEKKYWSCTSGAASTPTVKGSFTVQSKGLAFGSGYTCWYYTQFYGNYLFHSILYNPGSKTSVQDGRLGINASHGCVRLSLANAKWIYDNIPRGTKVIIY